MVGKIKCLSCVSLTPTSVFSVERNQRESAYIFLHICENQDLEEEGGDTFQIQ